VCIAMIVIELLGIVTAFVDSIGCAVLSIDRVIDFSGL